MPAALAPSAEACQAIVARINSGTAYTLPQPAEYVRDKVDPLQEVTGLRVDVVPETEAQLRETLAPEDPTTHAIHVWIRNRLADTAAATIDTQCLIVRQIFRRLDNWDSADGRVRVWEAAVEPADVPHKELLREARLFVASIVLRVTVEPAA